MSQPRHACDSTEGTSVYAEQTIITHYEDSAGTEIQLITVNLAP